MPLSRRGILMVLALLVAGIAVACAPKDPPKTGLEDPRVGQSAPDFSIPQLGADGEEALSDHRGKVVLIDFWATTCPPCRRSLPHLQSLAERHADDPFVMLSVNVDIPDDGRNALVSSFMERFDLDFPVLMDNGRASVAYDVSRIPLVVIVGADGKIRRVFQGFTEPDIIDAAVASVLAESAS